MKPYNYTLRDIMPARERLARIERDYAHDLKTLQTLQGKLEYRRGENLLGDPEIPELEDKIDRATAAQQATLARVKFAREKLAEIERVVYGEKQTPPLPGGPRDRKIGAYIYCPLSRV